MELTPRQRRTAALAALLGNALEWYDFAVYGYVASALGAAFFPADVPALQTMASFGVFAVGYLMRPVGSVGSEMCIRDRCWAPWAISWAAG